MLRFDSLSVRRGGRQVLREISGALMPAGALIVTGANGSGKSTLLRALAGLLPMASGALSWNGIAVDADPEAHRQRLHYLGHLDGVKNELSVAETLAYWRALRGLPPAPVGQLLELWGLSALESRRGRLLSAGQKRRLALMRLTFDEAPLWLLDEPMTALDPEGQARLLTLLAAHRAKGGMAVIATHQPLALPDAGSLPMGGGK